MIYKGRGVFVGADGSMGFEYGRGYAVRISKRSRLAKRFGLAGNIILRTKVGLYCPYSSMEKLEENWELER